MKPHTQLPGALAITLLAALAACGRPDTAPPRWIRLAQGFEPVALEARVERWEGLLAAGERARVEADPQGYGVWLETTLGDWEPIGQPGASAASGGWETTRSLRGALAYAGAQRARLAGVDLGLDPAAATGLPVAVPKVLPPVPDKERRVPPRSFYLVGERVHLDLPAGEEPPPGMTLAVRIEGGVDVNGARRVTLGRSILDGIPVWAGTFEECQLRYGPASTLRFATAFQEERGPEGTFRILLNGEQVFQHVQVNREEVGDWHEVPLPPPRAGDNVLRFEYAGAPGLGVYVDPTIGPADIGAPAERPWGAGRPNLVLFLADTFRADNLALYGGDPELTPHLNRFADESVRFLQARAPAAWTLPSISSLLTGRFPPQHGAVDRENAISTELLTLGEFLTEHGFRTVAITDGAVVSRTYNMDQGFAWYQEAPSQDERSLQRTFELALELLGRDDGRPVFFFVHSYRAHSPFRTGQDESSELYDVVMARVRARIDEGAGRVEAALAESTDLLALYRQGANALDETFGLWLARLDALGVFAPGYLIVTSDHGEAFGEHGEMWHDGRLWDEKIRIPLLIRGTGQAPRDVTVAATLVDLPVTFAALSGLTPPPSWLGSPLLELERERPNLSFQLGARGPQEVTIVSGTHKVFAPYAPDALAQGRHARAFDLDQDPDERKNLVGAPWAGQLATEVAPLLQVFEAARIAPSDSELSAEMRRALAELGYGGDDEE